VPNRSLRIHELSAGKRFLVFVGACLIKLLCATLRYRLVDEAGFLKEERGPVVMLIWHNRILAMPTLFRRHYRRRKGLLVLTSASRDGAYLSEFMRWFGMGSVRGSTSRRGGLALLNLMRKVDEKFDICITPDGPRGPKYRLGSGALLLAQQCNIPLMPFHIEYASYWRLRSWDGFAIPRPFSKVTVTLLPYIEIPRTDSEESFEMERRRAETAMTERMVML
jgi:lysophospholipid acyltransferase (LPLAT)-like uncharacterized protein